MKTRNYARIAARLLLALFSVASFFTGLTQAQTFDLDAARISLTQVDSAWRFHLGDDTDGKEGWAQTGFDDTSWPVLHPEDNWNTQGYPAKTELAWFRFHLLVPAHTQSLVLNLPEIEKSFQLFCDGQLIGQIGTLPPGPAHNVIGAPRVFTLSVNSGLNPKNITVALCLWQDPATAGARASVLEGTAYAGSPDAVLDHFATGKAANLLSDGSSYTIEIIRIIVGAGTVLLFWFTRERFYLWFACNLIPESLFFPIDLASAHQAWGLYFTTGILILIDFLSQATYIGFFVSALHSNRTKPILLPAALALLGEISIILVLKHAISLKWGDIGYCLTNIAVSIIIGWYLVRGWRAGNLYAKFLFIPYAVSAIANVLNNIGGVLSDLDIRFAKSVIARHYILLRDPFEINLDDLFSLIGLVGMLAVLVYRFARTSREQQRLASALQAAHDIQNRLVPVNIPTLGGLRAEIAYRAAEEVGGDFCQILPRPDGSILVANGDVSGKGLQAAMLGAVAVGALRSLADEAIAPVAVLERLNHVLLRTENAGFVTCLCLVLTSEGEVLVSNAGHLAPYLDGAEISVEPGLPLGILGGVRYSEDAFLLPGNARLTQLSDGVVEARSGSGELFGFERTCEVSQLPASEIADRAYQFGQEDDITVITLDWRAGILAAA
jgi:sigma-B regulation protein RsbU (phosphoserine phosphatase)